MRRALSIREKIVAYGIGVILGLLILGVFQRLRNPGDGEPERFLGKSIQGMIEQSGLRNLPEGSPEYLRQSDLLDTLITQPDERGVFKYIWILQVEEGHPRVRVVERLRMEDSGEGIESLDYVVMAADEVLVTLLEGADLKALDAVLAENGWVRGPYYEGAGAWLVRLRDAGVLGVPKATARLEAHTTLIERAEPRTLNWK